MTRRELLLTLSSLTPTLPTLAQPRTPSPRTLPTLLVHAGPLPRTNAIVRFTLPATARGESLQLRNEATQTATPLQINSDRTAWFILDSLPAGESQRFVIEPALDRPSWQWPAEALPEPDSLALRIQQRLVARYQIERTPPPRTDIDPALQRTAYLHPVRTPSGLTVTDDYPISAPEHHGIWTAWGKSTFQSRTPDFWHPTARTGRVEFEALLSSWSGHIHAGFRSRHRLVDLSTSIPITALTEIWETTAYAITHHDNLPFRMIDITSIHEAATNDPVTLLAQPTGGFAIRGRASWSQPGQPPVFLHSEPTQRSSPTSTRARWCFMGGREGRDSCGIAILSAPTNPHAPLRLNWREHEPFCCFTPVVSEHLQIQPGEPLTTRIRILAIDGLPNEPWLEQQWQTFANPVLVQP